MSSCSLVTRTVRLTAIGALLIVAALALSTTLSADGADSSLQPTELGVAWSSGSLTAFFGRTPTPNLPRVDGGLEAGGDISLNHFSVAESLVGTAPGVGQPVVSGLSSGQQFIEQAQQAFYIPKLARFGLRWKIWPRNIGPRKNRLRG